MMVFLVDNRNGLNVRIKETDNITDYIRETVVDDNRDSWGEVTYYRKQFRYNDKIHYLYLHSSVDERKVNDFFIRFFHQMEEDVNR